MTLPPNTPAKKPSLADMVAALRAKRAAEEAHFRAQVTSASSPEVTSGGEGADAERRSAPLMQALTQTLSTVASTPATSSSPREIVLNEAQQRFIDLAMDFSDPTPVVMLGPAGTGKTTAIAGLFEALFTQGALPQVTWRHRHLPGTSIGACVVAFTRRATTNVRKRMPKDIQGNAVTIHKLLEYAPVDDLVPVRDKDGNATGKTRMARIFKPMRDELNKLPDGLKLLIVEEVSMLGLLLDANLQAALPADTKLVLVGDLAQLVPVMDTTALAKYLQKAHVVELTEVYRQALDSPIISLATDIRRGKTRIVKEKVELVSPTGTSKLTLHPWKKVFSIPETLAGLRKFFEQQYAAGQYDPVEDQILIPFVKDGTIGSTELNRHIGTMLARAHKTVVYQIIAGFEQRCFAVGDYVIYDKQDCVITKIEKNRAYGGRAPLPPSATMDYWGHDPHYRASLQAAAQEADDVDHLLYMTSKTFDPDDPENKGQANRAASHTIHMRLLEDDSEFSISSAGDVNKTELAYAMTVHKAQGSEWDRVYVVLHADHNVMLSQELLYTACTRAKKELYVLCNPDTFVTGVLRQEIAGYTLAEKIRGLKLKLKIAEMRVKQ